MTKEEILGFVNTPFFNTMMTCMSVIFGMVIITYVKTSYEIIKKIFHKIVKIVKMPFLLIKKVYRKCFQYILILRLIKQYFDMSQVFYSREKNLDSLNAVVTERFEFYLKYYKDNKDKNIMPSISNHYIEDVKRDFLL